MKALFRKDHAQILREVAAPAHHQVFHCPVCGKDCDGENIPEMLEHYRHIINSAYYSYLHPAK